jgi:phosphoribosylformylglycinamidine (FGAM) synthase PurS component
MFEIEALTQKPLEADGARYRNILQCAKVLSNPVIEDYRVEIEG